MSLLFKDLIRQGSALVFIHDVLLMSSSEPHLLQLVKQLHDIAIKKIWIYLLKNLFSCSHSRIYRHEIGFNTKEPTQSKLAANHIFLPPTAKSELMRFIGSKNFFSKFLDKIMMIRSLCNIHFIIVLNSIGVMNREHCIL